MKYTIILLLNLLYSESCIRNIIFDFYDAHVMTYMIINDISINNEKGFAKLYLDSNHDLNIKVIKSELENYKLIVNEKVTHCDYDSINEVFRITIKPFINSSRHLHGHATHYKPHSFEKDDRYLRIRLYKPFTYNLTWSQTYINYIEKMDELNEDKLENTDYLNFIEGKLKDYQYSDKKNTFQLLYDSINDFGGEYKKDEFYKIYYDYLRYKFTTINIDKIMKFFHDSLDSDEEATTTGSDLYSLNSDEEATTVGTSMYKYH